MQIYLNFRIFKYFNCVTLPSFKKQENYTCLLNMKSRVVKKYIFLPPTPLCFRSKILFKFYDLRILKMCDVYQKQNVRNKAQNIERELIMI